MNCKAYPILRTVGKMCVSAALVCVVLGAASAWAGESGTTTGRLSLPEEFGQVIYQKYADRPNQIFIIGQSHRSASTGANGANTVRAQVEIFRIGEWLIEQEHVRLLLPEGFFRRKAEGAPVFATAEGATGELLRGPALDNETLHAKLTDTQVFTNADILLKNRYNIRLQQVEDEGIYLSVREFMRAAYERPAEPLSPGFRSELGYLQELRTAAMLQNIPAAVDEEFEQGLIGPKRAILTIGMAHLSETIRFLEDEFIRVAPPAFGNPLYEEYASVMKLLEAGYGVTIILPRALVEDREALKMVRLDTI